MPFSPTLFLYGLSIILGVLLVAWGLSPRFRKEGPPSASCRHAFSSDLSPPTDDVLPLQFLEEPAEPEVRIPGSSKQPAPNATSAEGPPGGGVSRRRGSFLGTLTAPLRVWGRERKREERELLDTPITSTLLISARDPKTKQEPEGGQ